MRIELMTSSLPRKRSTTELHRLLSGKRGSNPPPTAWKAVALPNELFPLLRGEGGFEPPKAAPTDLQSAPFDRSGTSPYNFSELSRWRDSNPRPADYKSAALAS
jgi:hypothetical protein